jgi:hypothetical protein
MEHSLHLPVVKTWSEGASLTRLVLAEAGPSCRRTDAVDGEQQRVQQKAVDPVPGHRELVEAVALPLGREVGQPVQLQPGPRALPGLPFDRLHRASGCGLRRGHAGGRERLHRHRLTVRQRNLVRLRALPEIDHDSSFVNEAQRQGRRGLHREPGVVGVRLLCFLTTKTSNLDCIGHPGHLELHGEANNSRLRSIGSGR